MKHPSFPDGVDRDALIAWFRDGRERTKRVFAIPKPETYYERPIALRNPIVFYEGHLPAFSINTLIKLALGRPGIHSGYEELFARGIDPETEAAVNNPTSLWPSREDVLAYSREADRIIERALCDGPIEDDAVPQLRGAEAAFAILEHEQMHQETLLYMFHNMPYEKKNPSSGAARHLLPSQRGEGTVMIPAGTATLGAEHDEIGFAWDNELPSLRVHVPEFTIDTHSVTNGDYLEFMDATGAPAPHFWTEQDGQRYWRGMFELIPLPVDWPVWVTYDEAEAYARWKGGRVPREAEYHRAAFGTPAGDERLFPWGDELPDERHGNFGFMHWDPVPVGSYPAGASAWGVHDLVGNGWEWTSTVFDGFPGFQPMASYPVYSNDFFDGGHYVIKGASPATMPQLIRRSFRNWFRPNYPYVFAKFRVASSS